MDKLCDRLGFPKGHYRRHQAVLAVLPSTFIAELAQELGLPLAQVEKWIGASAHQEMSIQASQVFCRLVDTLDGLLELYEGNLRIPGPSGHRFHADPATRSTRIQPLIPRPSGHPLKQAATQDYFTTIGLFFEAERSSWSVYLVRSSGQSPSEAWGLWSAVRVLDGSRTVNPRASHTA